MLTLSLWIWNLSRKVTNDQILSMSGWAEIVVLKKMWL